MLLHFLPLGLLLGIVIADQQNGSTADPPVDDDPFYPPLEWSDAFDWKVLRVLSKKSANVLFSPASLKIVSGILYEASSGVTQKDFENSLQFLSKKSLREKTKNTLSSLRTGDTKLKVNTKMFLESTIPPKLTYSKRIKDFYDADIQPVSFNDARKASEQINSWAANVTGGNLQNMTSPDEIKDMVILLSNVIYFKGIWRHQFPKNATCVRGFYTTPDMKIFLPFMTKSESFYYFESDMLGAKILRLPYEKSSFSMILILPFSKGGLPELVQQISLMNLHRELHFLDKKVVTVSIPRFSFQMKGSYKDVFRQFGLNKIFQNSASLSGISEGNSVILRELVVSDIIQTTILEVDEEGSLAFSATNVLIGNKIGTPEAIFNADHPFLFLIQDDASGTILFLGKMENPLEQETEVKHIPEDSL